jgi:hypothetical protein
MGEEGQGRNSRSPREEKEDFLRKLVVWIQRSVVLEEVIEKAPYKMLLKIGTGNPLYQALNNNTK